MNFETDLEVKDDEMDIDSIYNFYIRRALYQCFIYVCMFAAVLLLVSVAISQKQAFGAEGSKYKRIVSIGGSLTEIVFALGEGHRLIARDTTSVYPQQAFDLPDVGYMRQLSPEGVLSVDPDLILAIEGSGPPETIETLKAANVPIVLVPEGYSSEMVSNKILAVGDALGIEGRANKLAGETSKSLELVSRKVKASPTKKKVLFVLSLQGGKILASGTGTAANGIIEMAGGENILSSFPGYRQVSDEAIITGQPDVILMMQSRGNHGLKDEEVLAHPAIQITPAGKSGNLVRMDGLFMLGFGPRVADAVATLHETLR